MQGVTETDSPKMKGNPSFSSKEEIQSIHVDNRTEVKGTPFHNNPDGRTKSGRGFVPRNKG